MKKYKIYNRIETIKKLIDDSYVKKNPYLKHQLSYISSNMKIFGPVEYFNIEIDTENGN